MMDWNRISERYSFASIVKANQPFTIIEGDTIDYSSIDEIFENTEIIIYDRQKRNAFTFPVDNDSDEEIIEMITNYIEDYEKVDQKEEDECQQ